MEQNEIPGIDTIRGLVGEPPSSIFVNRKVMETQQKLMQVWNSAYIAIIPYCYKCKEPLVWHSPPGEDNILFHCPKCKKIWMKDKSWND